MAHVQLKSGANILCDISHKKTKYYDKNIDFSTSFYCDEYTFYSVKFALFIE